MLCSWHSGQRRNTTSCVKPSGCGRRPKDQVDFDEVLPLLGRARRDVLSGWLERVHPGHPWLEELAG